MSVERQEMKTPGCVGRMGQLTKDLIRYYERQSAEMKKWFIETGRWDQPVVAAITRSEQYFEELGVIPLWGGKDNDKPTYVAIRSQGNRIISGVMHGGHFYPYDDYARPYDELTGQEQHERDVVVGMLPEVIAGMQKANILPSGELCATPILVSLGISDEFGAPIHTSVEIIGIKIS